MNGGSSITGFSVPSLTLRQKQFVSPTIRMLSLQLRKRSFAGRAINKCFIVRSATNTEQPAERLTLGHFFPTNGNANIFAGFSGSEIRPKERACLLHFRRRACHVRFARRDHAPPCGGHNQSAPRRHVWRGLLAGSTISRADHPSDRPGSNGSVQFVVQR